MCNNSSYAAMNVSKKIDLMTMKLSSRFKLAKQNCIYKRKGEVSRNHKSMHQEQFKKNLVKLLDRNPENVESETYHVLCNFPG